MKIVATSDLHLGMKFTGYPEVRNLLVHARFEALARIVQEANDIGADLLLIAGDLFDRPGVPERVITEALSIIARFEGSVVAILPGNHDYTSGAESATWNLVASLARDLKCSLVVLDEQRPYDLSEFDLPAFLLPGPCTSKHADHHTIGWIHDMDEPGFSLSADDSETPVLIGIAHGSIEGISPDLQGLYYPMQLSDLRRTPAHLWIIGHTHAQHRLQIRPGQELFVPGTPEPDGFDCIHEGRFWTIETSGGRIVNAESHVSGGYRFFDRSASLSSAADLESFMAEVDGVAGEYSLLRCRLEGMLPDEAFEAYREFAGSRGRNFCFFLLDDAGLSRELTRERIDERFPEGSFPHKLLVSFVDSGDLEAAGVALGLLERAGERTI